MERVPKIVVCRLINDDFFLQGRVSVDFSPELQNFWGAAVRFKGPPSPRSPPIWQVGRYLYIASDDQIGILETRARLTQTQWHMSQSPKKMPDACVPFWMVLNFCGIGIINTKFEYLKL